VRWVMMDQWELTLPEYSSVERIESIWELGSPQYSSF